MKKLIIIFGSAIFLLLFVVLLRFIVMNEKVTYGVNTSEDSLFIQLEIARRTNMNTDHIANEKIALQMVKSILGKKYTW